MSSRICSTSQGVAIYNAGIKKKKQCECVLMDFSRIDKLEAEIYLLR